MPPQLFKQNQALNVALVVALAFGSYFLRGYISIIVLAAIAAFIFYPVHKRLMRRYKRPGISASLTFVFSLIVVIIPLTAIVLITIAQVKSLLHTLSSQPSLDYNSAAQSLLDSINRFLSHFPSAHQLTMDDINKFFTQTISKLANNILSILTSSVGTISRFITYFIIYIYVFVNLLMHQDTIIKTLKGLNPLGDKISDIYLKKMGSMTKAMALGQFVIASLQGTESAILLYLVGFHNLFFFFLILLSFLSLIPLGAGIITIPIGIVLILTGNIWQGVAVIANHLLIVTNIDNVVRPQLVPKEAKLNSALTILGVFAGVAMFGFLGIIIGPVIMILITTTISTYLEAQAKNR
jgi:predicted PurR-regulated permease PerM